VFAPVVRLEAIRLLLALASNQGWKVHHMDVKLAFLNGDLREEVYGSQPPGFIERGKEHLVLRLNKALYGLHQAPRAWNKKLDESLLSVGFLRCPSDPAIYCRGDKNGGRLVIGVYVDDLAITGSSKQGILKVKEEMTAMFKMSDLGLLDYFLGIEVKQKGDGFVLSQASYARKILEKVGMVDCNSCKIPMEPKIRLSKENSSPLVDATSYIGQVGSLRYLVNTRPDLTFLVGYVSRFMQELSVDHLAAVKHILRYISEHVTGVCSILEGGKKIQHLLVTTTMIWLGMQMGGKAPLV
jgi:hypothetical protein